MFHQGCTVLALFFTPSTSRLSWSYVWYKWIKFVLEVSFFALTIVLHKILFGLDNFGHRLPVSTCLYYISSMNKSVGIHEMLTYWNKFKACIVWDVIYQTVLLNCVKPVNIVHGFTCGFGHFLWHEAWFVIEWKIRCEHYNICMLKRISKPYFLSRTMFF